MYEEQHDFNLKVLKIQAGMSLIKERNKFLVLADSFGWDVALCCAKELLTEDSEDERKIHRAKKEGKIWVECRSMLRQRATRRGQRG